MADNFTLEQIIEALKTGLTGRSGRGTAATASPAVTFTGELEEDIKKITEQLWKAQFAASEFHKELKTTQEAGKDIVESAEELGYNYRTIGELNDEINAGMHGRLNAAEREIALKVERHQLPFVPHNLPVKGRLSVCPSTNTVSR